MWYLGEGDDSVMDEEDHEFLQPRVQETSGIHKEMMIQQEIAEGGGAVKRNETASGEGATESRKMLQEFLRKCKCEWLIPKSGKIVVLDTALAVKVAFHALEENNLKSAPLWDSEAQDYVGIITVSDFIEILLHFAKEDPKVDLFQELEKHQIKTWRGLDCHLPLTQSQKSSPTNIPPT